MSNWIEIAGLPATGKTTLIKKHSAVLHKKFCVVESRHPTIFHRILAKLYLHGWLRWIMRDKKLAGALAYRLSFRSLLLGTKPVLFYDSGIVQFILEAVIAGTEDEKPLLQVLDCFAPDRIVYLTDNIDAVIAREMNRATRRFPDMDAKMLKERYEKAEELLKTRVFPLIGTVSMVNIHDENDFLEQLSA